MSLCLCWRFSIIHFHLFVYLFTYLFIRYSSIHSIVHLFTYITLLFFSSFSVGFAAHRVTKSKLLINKPHIILISKDTYSLTLKIRSMKQALILDSCYSLHVQRNVHEFLKKYIGIQVRNAEKVNQ